LCVSEYTPNDSSEETVFETSSEGCAREILLAAEHRDIIEILEYRHSRRVASGM
jgi:hypothetical protein